MEYLIITFSFFLFFKLYFKIAKKYNITDTPNHRSAHQETTLRGGGIIYPIAFSLFFLVYWYQNVTKIYQGDYAIFGIGLLMISIVSFIDDITELSSKIRIVVHFLSTAFLLIYIGAFGIIPYWSIPLFFILIMGILNAYNFMDGINGMSGFYSLITLATLLYIQQYNSSFTDNQFIIYPLIASVVFLFYNFRNKAKCFMGDVGSFSIAFWIVTLIGLLIVDTGDFRWIFLLTIYGIDTIFTLIERLYRKENIFEAHRRHFYQLLSNELKWDHRLVSVIFSIVQLVLNFFLVFKNLEIMYIILMQILVAILYIFLKIFIKKKQRNIA